VLKARPRGVTPADASAVATETTTATRARTAVHEIPARPSDRIPDTAEVRWAAAAPAPREDVTGPIDVVEHPLPVAHQHDRVGPPMRGTPLTGVPVPLVVPGTPSDPAPALVMMAPVATVATVDAPAQAARRKDRPKVVRLPRRTRIRKVSRVIRSIDAWSVFKVSVVFYMAMYVVFLLAGVLLWNVAYSTGTIDNVSGFFESFGWKSFEFRGGEIYHNAWIIGLFVVAGLTGMNVVLATLYNLITDLVGGIRITMLEEEVLVRAAPSTDGARRGTSTTTIKPTRRDVRRARRGKGG